MDHYPSGTVSAAFPALSRHGALFTLSQENDPYNRDW